MGLKFDPSKFCPEDIAEVAVTCFMRKKGCNEPAFRIRLGLTTEEFIDAIADILGPLPNIKGTTQEFTINNLHFELTIRKDGVANLTEA